MGRRALPKGDGRSPGSTMGTLKTLHHSRLATKWGSMLAETYIRLVFRTSKLLRDPPDINAKLFSQTRRSSPCGTGNS